MHTTRCYLAILSNNPLIERVFSTWYTTCPKGQRTMYSFKLFLRTDGHDPSFDQVGMGTSFVIFESRLDIRQLLDPSPRHIRYPEMRAEFQIVYAGLGLSNGDFLFDDRGKRITKPDDI